jgi:hypothetical protein
MSEQLKKAEQRLMNPETYPGLIQRNRQQRKLLIWCYPTFQPYSSWSIFDVDHHYWVRRIEWSRARHFSSNTFSSDDVDPYTYGCEAVIGNKSANTLLTTLSEFTLRPFQQPELMGRDGTIYGIEIGADWLPCRLTWWNLSVDDWQPLADWFERAVTEFEAVLPASTSCDYS